LLRRRIVKQVRAGSSYRDVARRLRVGLATVARWVKRAHGLPLNRVDWRDRSDRPRRVPRRTCQAIVGKIAKARRHLSKHDALGEHGPEAIRRHLLATGVAAPSARTIARWIAKLGLSGRERWRRPPPPKGWYLADLAAGRVEADCVDVVEGLRLRRSGRTEVLNVISLWGNRPDSTAAPSIRTDQVIAQLRKRWQRDGLPVYVQFDNDTIFTGAHAKRDILGRVVHLCLCLGVTPVFAVPLEPGFQAKIEAYNRRWQDGVWKRWRHPSIPALQRRSDAFVSAWWNAKASGHENRALRSPWIEPASQPRTHRIVMLRRLDDQGRVTLCAQRLRVAKRWACRLVRCEINVKTQTVTIYGLTRRDPRTQPVLKKRALHVRLVSWSKAPK
jgi:hypothetical protein